MDVNSHGGCEFLNALVTEVSGLFDKGQLE